MIKYANLSPALKWAVWGGYISLVSSVVGFFIGFFGAL
jgi:hypothetical protein